MLGVWRPDPSVNHPSHHATHTVQSLVVVVVLLLLLLLLVVHIIQKPFQKIVLGFAFPLFQCLQHGLPHLRVVEHGFAQKVLP